MAALQSGEPLPKRDLATDPLVAGDDVEVDTGGKGAYFPGAIAAARLHQRRQSFDIEYDDGSTEQHVPFGRVRLPEKLPGAEDLRDSFKVSTALLHPSVLRPLRTGAAPARSSTRTATARSRARRCARSWPPSASR